MLAKKLLVVAFVIAIVVITVGGIWFLTKDLPCKAPCVYADRQGQAVLRTEDGDVSAVLYLNVGESGTTLLVGDYQFDVLTAVALADWSEVVVILPDSSTHCAANSKVTQAYIYRAATWQAEQIREFGGDIAGLCMFILPPTRQLLVNEMLY